MSPENQKILANCFAECVNQQMTDNQCRAYIESILGQDLELSVFPDLKLKIRYPRTPSVKAASYWYIGLPTNLDGQVSCDINNAVVDYPFAWETDQGVFSIPDTECFGMNANECCAAIMENISNAGVPFMDRNGNCLSCWVHQEILTPIVGTSGDIMYLNHENVGGICIASELTTPQVQAKDDVTEAELTTLRSTIENMIKNGGSCEDLDQLQRDLLLWGRVKPHAMKAIGSLLCGFECDGNGTYPNSVISVLGFIKVFISGEVNSDVNTLVVYTDAQGLVMEPPKIGGSRAELDIDRNDTQCDESEGEVPYSVNPVKFSNGTAIPSDKGVCDATALSDQSAKDQECTSCRQCLARKCDWRADSTCRRLMFGVITGTSEQWMSCLKSNGFTAELTNPVKPAGFNDWCHCAVKCEDYCLKEDLTYFKDPREKECTATDMSNRSEKGEQCNNCRTCLQQECNWPKKTWCALLLTGHRKGDPEQWLACLESNGSTKVLTNGIEGKGDRDTWGECGRRCDNICLKQVISRSNLDNPICTAEDLSLRSATHNDVCFNCRQCIVRKCDYWKARCELLATGEAIGTPEEWNKCFTQCGRGLRSAMKTETIDTSGERVGWCDCARKCDDRCNHVIPDKF